MSKPTLTVQLMHANARIAELEATLVKARECYRELRSSIIAPIVVAPKPDTAVITRYTDRLGRTFERTRIGNKASIREITTSTTLN